MQTSLRGHSKERISDWLTLSYEEVIEILDTGKSCPIGKDGNSNKVHRLFFSILDNYWFVAVQDEKTGEVVTVLPVDYHNRWRVSWDALDIAKKLATEQTQKEQPAKEIGESKKITARFIATIENSENTNSRRAGLGSFYFKYPTDICQIEMDDTVQNLIKEKIRHVLKKNEFCSSVEIRMGKRGWGLPRTFNIKE